MYIFNKFVNFQITNYKNAAPHPEAVDARSRRVEGEGEASLIYTIWNASLLDSHALSSVKKTREQAH